MKALLVTLTFVVSLSAQVSAQVKLPADGRVDIWPTIPFVRGADLCQYKDAYGQTRSEYLQTMVTHAKDLINTGAKGKEALDLLVNFSNIYDHNQALAVRHQYLDVTLEATLKSYMSGYYRNLRPKTTNVSFSYVNDIISIVNAAKNGQRDGYLDQTILDKLDYIAYGTYALAPNCIGDIQVTLHMIGRNGLSESYIATGRPEYVMSTIASEIFTQFQRTQFPVKIKIGQKHLTLIGGLNGSVDRVADPLFADEACKTLEGRLPTLMELEMISSYGDWSGGVSVAEGYWAMPEGKVFSAQLRNPSPLREKWEVNADEYLYYCVR